VPIPLMMGFDQATLDAFSLTTDHVLQHEKSRVAPTQMSRDDEPKERARRSVVIDERGDAYGRRRTDIPLADIKRTIEAVQQIKGAGGVPEDIISVPDWATTLVAEHVRGQEQRNGVTHDLGTHADVLDLQPAEDGMDRPTLLDNSRESKALGSSSNDQNGA
jgi:hypothetical protein